MIGIVLYWKNSNNSNRLSKFNHPMLRSAFILTILLVLLASCMPVQTGTPTPIASQTSSSLPEQFNRLATQTQSAVQTSIVVAGQQAATQMGISAVTPSALPYIAPVLEEVGPFRQVSRREALIIGKVLDFQAIREGFLLFSEGGISYFQDDEWTGYFTQPIGSVVGVDSSAHAWIANRDTPEILRSNEQVSRHRDSSEDTEAWVTFGAEQGWSPVNGSVNPVKYGLFTDHRGVLWAATDKDVRSFDGSRWQVYDSQVLGMPAPNEGAAMTFMIFPSKDSADVYVGRCDWGGAGPVGGGGVRAFDGQVWRELDPSLNMGCASAISDDGRGGLWVASDASLHHYDQVSTSWQQVPLPEAPPQSVFRYFNDLTPGPEGDLWAQLALCSDDTCLGGEVLYRLLDSDWQQVGEPSLVAGQKLLFDSTGSPWLFSAGSVYQIEGNSLLSVPGLVVLAATTDVSGKLWLVAQSAGPPTLWSLP